MSREWTQFGWGLLMHGISLSASQAMNVHIFSLFLWSNTKCLGAGSGGGIFGWSLHPQQSSRKGARGARLPMLLQTVDWNAIGCEVVYFGASVRSMILGPEPFVALSSMFVCSILVSLRVVSHHLVFSTNSNMSISVYDRTCSLCHRQYKCARMPWSVCDLDQIRKERSGSQAFDPKFDGILLCFHSVRCGRDGVLAASPDPCPLGLWRHWAGQGGAEHVTLDFFSISCGGYPRHLDFSCVSNP